MQSSLIQRALRHENGNTLDKGVWQMCASFYGISGFNDRNNVQTRFKLGQRRQERHRIAVWLLFGSESNL